MFSRMIPHVLLSALALTSQSAVAADDAVADFYKGRTLNIVVGLAAGGGYDQYARTLARHLDKHLPGKPTLVVQNMTGAAGMTSANWAYNIAPRDGSAIVLTQRSVLVEPLYGTKEAAFDPRKFSWLASLNDETFIAVVWKDRGIESIRDAQERVFEVAADGPASDDFVWPAVLNSVIGTRFKVISGYKGKAEERLAVRRGETHGLIGWSWGSLKSSDYAAYQAGDWKIIATLGRARHPEFEAPSIFQYAATKEAEDALDFLESTLILGRPVFAPPGIPADRENALRRALDATVKDADFLADAERQKLEITPSTGEQLAQRVDRLYATSPDIVARVQAARKQATDRRASAAPAILR